MSNPELSGRYPMPWGYIEINTNEVSIVSTVEDPPKVRMGAVAGGSLGCLSFNHVRPDGVQEEVALMQGKIDERFRSATDGGTGQQTELVGEVRFDIKGPLRGQTDDKATVAVMQLQHDRIVVHKPLVDPQGNAYGGGEGGGIISDIWAPNGLGVTQMNPDGNFVTYRLERPFDKGRYKATFSSDSGVIPVDKQKWEGV